MRARTSASHARVASQGEVTLDELCVELSERGIEVHRATVGRFLHRLGLSNKKSLKASEQRRPEIARRVSCGSTANDLQIRAV
jgi:transposase